MKRGTTLLLGFYIMLNTGLLINADSNCHGAAVRIGEIAKLACTYDVGKTHTKTYLVLKKVGTGEDLVEYVVHDNILTTKTFHFGTVSHEVKENGTRVSFTVCIKNVKQEDAGRYIFHFFSNGDTPSEYVSIKISETPEPAPTTQTSETPEPAPTTQTSETPEPAPTTQTSETTRTDNNKSSINDIPTWAIGLMILLVVLVIGVGVLIVLAAIICRFRHIHCVGAMVKKSDYEADPQEMTPMNPDNSSRSIFPAAPAKKSDYEADPQEMTPNPDYSARFRSIFPADPYKQSDYEADPQEMTPNPDNSARSSARYIFPAAPAKSDYEADPQEMTPNPYNSAKSIARSTQRVAPYKKSDDEADPQEITPMKPDYARSLSANCDITNYNRQYPNHQYTAVGVTETSSAEKAKLTSESKATAWQYSIENKNLTTSLPDFSYGLIYLGAVEKLNGTET